MPRQKGFKHSPEAIANMKAASNTPESKEKRRQSHLDKKLSEEHKAAIKAGLNKPETRALRSEIAKRHKHTEETKLLLSEIMHSPEVNAKISEGVKRNYDNPEYKESHRLASMAMMTEEYRAKMSKSISKRWERLTQEEKDKFVWTLVKHGPTTIELRIKSLLEALGVEYKEQYKIGSYTIDFYVPSTNLVLEAYGCYWHGCEECGFINTVKNGKDAKRRAYLEKKGYTVVTFWEHEIRAWEDE